MPVIQRINDGVLGRNTWPPPQQRPVWDAIDLWAAFRRSDETRIKQQAGIPWHRRYVMSPVPRIVSRAKANLLYGEPCDVRAASEADQDAMDRIMRENAMAAGHSAELHRAASIASSEREVWGRIVVDPSVLDVPIIEFCSRRHVIPKFRGRFVAGAVFVKEWPDGSRKVWRLLEHYDPGEVRSELWLGSTSLLGTQVDLKSFEPTKDVVPLTITGFDRPLCVFIPNAVDGDPTAGYSDYQGLEERFLAINETATVGQENLRLAGKKRALIDGKYMRGGKVVDGDDVWVRQDEAVMAGEGHKPLQLLEYEFEAEPLKVYLDNLIDTTLMFAGTAPQLAGRAVDGGAVSGTALRLKMVHSLMESAGTGGHFDRGVQALARMAAIVDGRRTGEGGFGRRWQKPDEDPAVTRGDGLPADDMEAAQWLVLVAGAEAISLEEKVRWIHPEWGDDQVEDEVRKIQEEADGKEPDDELEGGPAGGLPALPAGQPSPTPPGLPDPGTARTPRT